MVVNLTNSLCNIAKTTGVKFIFCSKPISYEEIFADTGLLPAIAQRADHACSLCLGYGIGVTFVEAEKSLLGIQVQFDDITPDTLRLVYIYDAILEIIKANESQDKDRISLDELMYD